MIEKIFIEIDKGDPPPPIVDTLSAILNDALRAAEADDDGEVIAEMQVFNDTVNSLMRNREMDAALGETLIDLSNQLIQELESTP